MKKTLANKQSVKATSKVNLKKGNIFTEEEMQNIIGLGKILREIHDEGTIQI